MTETPVPTTTTDAGIPISSDDHSLTLGDSGPILLQDHYLIQKMAQFNRERVPERVVHAKGGGAFGFFETTDDVSEFTKAAMFQPGRKTEAVARFSTVAGELGSPDTWRDPRGFALKFYTEQGNYDLVGNNTPIFFVRDPQNFQDFIHSQKRRADNQMRDHNMQWDFWTLKPESAHQVTYLMGDRGVPSTWRNMNGYGSHTFLWENAAGVRHWVKYHFHTDQGMGYLSQADADRIAGEGGDYHRRDLWEAIKRGRRRRGPVGPAHADRGRADYRFNPFDLTRSGRTRLPAGEGGPAGAGPQPGELLRPDRAGGVRAGEHGPGHRPVAGQDATRPTVLLPGHAPLPHRRQLPAAAGQHTQGAGPLVQPRRADAKQQPG
jgi:catalase